MVGEGGRKVCGLCATAVENLFEFVYVRACVCVCVCESKQLNLKHFVGFEFVSPSDPGRWARISPEISPKHLL